MIWNIIKAAFSRKREESKQGRAMQSFATGLLLMGCLLIVCAVGIMVGLVALLIWLF